MKNNTLLLFLLLFSISIFAQDYDPIIKEGSFWDVSTWDGGLCETDYTRYSIGEDITIEGKTYKRIKVQTIYGNKEHESDICITKPYYTKDDDNFFYLSEFIREDKAEKKVYILSTKFSQEHEEYTLYDFNLKVGDRIENSYVGNRRLEKIETDENGFKKFIFDSSLGNPYYYRERIGSNFGLCNFDTTYIGSGKNLICWGNQEEQNGCATTLNTNNYQLQSIKLFPNPVSSFLQIKNIQDVTLKVFSVDGRLLQTEKFNNEINMNVANLKTGIYFIEISNLTSRKRLKIFKN